MHRLQCEANGEADLQTLAERWKAEEMKRQSSLGVVSDLLGQLAKHTCQSPYFEAPDALHVLELSACPGAL